MHHLQ
jgi:hypothetical protein